MSPATSRSFDERYGHLIDPNKKWYHNRRQVVIVTYSIFHETKGDPNAYRLITLHAWLALL